MRKVLAWLGAAALFMVMSRAEAANGVLKPYVVLILDTSGSMLIPTGSGPTTCGKQDNRLNHAVCAINSIVNSYGDMVFSLGRFKEQTSGAYVNSCDANGNQEGNGQGVAMNATFPVPSGGDQCATQGAYCGDCNSQTGFGTNKVCTFCNSNADCGASTCNTTKHYCLSGACDITDSCAQGLAESGAQCTDNVDSDGDGIVNDGCPTNVTGTVAPEAACADNLDNDNDGLVNDGCPADTAARCSGTGACTNSDDNFEVITALVDGNNAQTATYTDGTCATCNLTGTDPEIWGVSSFTYTPLSATLKGAKRYWQGNQSADAGTTIFAQSTDGNLSLNPGFDPINDDPSNYIFLTGTTATNCDATPSCTPTVNGVCASGLCCCASQCRPYITILLTDGDETCTSFTNTKASAAAMLLTQPHTDSFSITSIGRAGGITTITTPNSPTAPPHPFKVGDQIQVSGTGAVNGFNGTFFVDTVPTIRSLTYKQTGSANVATVSPGGTVFHKSATYQYRIETKPIGFGIAPGSPEAAGIEDIAHAGGAPDVPNVDEGYYAQNEADLQLAISQILADSVRAELCNLQDDDCDTAVDEDFPNKGGICTNGLVGACAANGTLECRSDGQGLQCNAPVIPPGNEGSVCNQLDDDCDGRIDEGLTCTSCVPTGEICDGMDQDCDGQADKSCRCTGGTNAGKSCNPNVGGSCPGGACNCTSLTRPCGIGTCSGIETCTSGTYVGTCTAPQPVTEQCNGVDDDCDGICDAFDESCSEIGQTCNNTSGSCPGSTNPGSPLHNPQPIAQNICRPGVRSCPLKAACTAGNTFGQCSNEIKPCNGVVPCIDTCNGLDDDCDNLIDEGFVDADCSTNCGVGRTVCQNGNIVCNSTPATGDANCNAVDDDCDNKIDEDWACTDVVAPFGPGNCNSVMGSKLYNANCNCDACGTSTICNGQQACVNGAVVCQGPLKGVEVCNCLDDDCDGNTDEDPGLNPICPGGSTCVGDPSCQCAFQCAQSEFPCPLGKKCDIGDPNNANDDFCVNDVCYGVTCGPINGHPTTCIQDPNNANTAECVETCQLINDTDQVYLPSCSAGQICVDTLGECRPNNCMTFPTMCTGTQSCVNGVCISNPCQGVTCDGNSYCIGGECVKSCSDVTCQTGQRCVQGACETDPCGHPCPFGQACNDDTGQCREDPCKTRDCPDGQWCNPNDGLCEDDPCVVNSVDCPKDTDICRGGSCVDQDSSRPDAAGEAHVTVGGGGGCNTSGDAGSLLLALGALGLLITRRRRTVGGAL